MKDYLSSSGLQETAGFWGGLLRQVRLAWRLMTDNRVPAWIKMVPVAGLVYLLSPVDLVPDFVLPGLGELDDVAVILLSLKLFLDLSPSDVVRDHVEELFGARKKVRARETRPSESYIDAAYRVVEPGKE